MKLGLKLLTIIVVLFLLLLLVMLYFNLQASNASKIKLNAKKAIKEQFIPILIQPTIDLPRNNFESAYYVASETADRGQLVELTLVFRNETNPNRILDFIYTPFRRLKYGRYADIETLSIKLDQNKQLEWIDFSYKGKGTYSGNQRYDTATPRHISKKIIAEKFLFKNDRPVIYINTWNHLFAEVNTNKELELTEWTDYPLVKGDRRIAEQDLKKSP